MKHFKNYIDLVKANSSPSVAKSIEKTVNEFVPKHIETFDFVGEKAGLLLGNVQSGKTGQMLGILAAAADFDFEIFVVMTSDMTSLQEQTFKRALETLDTFCVCNESDDVRFMKNEMRKPVAIVIKKNTNILEKWKNNLINSNFLQGRPIFIIDDEGDAASLNTKTNTDDELISTINRKISEIRELANSSFYLQVTATPQSIFLQGQETGYKPEFVYYFEPGDGYLGGNFFYTTGRPDIEPQIPYPIELTGEEELAEMLDDEAPTPAGMQEALRTFLIVASHIYLNKMAESCNFMVHPSVSTGVHEQVAEKIGNALNSFFHGGNELESDLRDTWRKLHLHHPDIVGFKRCIEFISTGLENETFKIDVINSQQKNNVDFSKGTNIIIGGNSLSRGLTIPNLQVTYYCRKSKRFQADTAWQHCRAFGYDRVRGLARIFLPPSLFDNFVEINNSNNTIIEYVNKYGLDGLKLPYPKGINPTRPSVVNKLRLEKIKGGKDHFAEFPKDKNLNIIDEIINDLENTHNPIVTPRGNYLLVSLEKIKELINLCEAEQFKDWPAKTYIDCMKLLEDKNSTEAALIIRKDRAITRGTRTMLSPDDRAISNESEIKDKLVLTMYRIIGGVKHKWSGGPRWMPNIKFPEGDFYSLKES